MTDLLKLILGVLASLFRSRAKLAHQVLIELPTGEVVEVRVGEFLAYAPVVAFTEQVIALVAKAADAVATNSGRPVLVATGGGARLPIMRRLAEEGMEYQGRRFLFVSRDPAPAGMAEKYPDLVDPYPQIAVALGGSLPELPDQMPPIQGGVGSTPEGPRYMDPIYKS